METRKRPAEIECLKHGHCCQFFVYPDCNLYPIPRDGKFSGFCRERAETRQKEKRNRGNIPGGESGTSLQPQKPEPSIF